MANFNKKQITELDRLAVSGGLEIRQMMELAGWHMVGLFENLGISKKARVVVVCGKGNKGGDGLSAVRHLVNHGWSVSIVLLSEKISKGSNHHLKLLRKMDLPIFLYSKDKKKVFEIIKKAGVLIDALIGYNLDGAPRGDFAEVIELMNEVAGEGKSGAGRAGAQVNTKLNKKNKKIGAKIISYDTPTGLDAESGKVFEPCVNAYATLALAVPKRGVETTEGKKKTGKLFVADIGIPEFMYDKVVKNSRPKKFL